MEAKPMHLLKWYLEMHCLVLIYMVLAGITIAFICFKIFISNALDNLFSSRAFNPMATYCTFSYILNILHKEGYGYLTKLLSFQQFQENSKWQGTLRPPECREEEFGKGSFPILSLDMNTDKIKNIKYKMWKSESF